MTHEISKAETGFDHIAWSDRKTPWHELGVAWAKDYPMMPTEAFELAKLNYKTQKLPYHVDLPDGSQIGGDDFLLVREPMPGIDEHWRQLGIVTAGYEIIDNMYIAEVLDNLAKYTPLDVVGALQKYSVIFATFRAGNLDIMVNGKTDNIELYLLFLENKKPGNSIQFILSPIRTVCMNTVVAAEATAKLKITLSHHAGANNYFQWTTDTLASIASQQMALKAAMQMMADRKIDHETALTVIDRAFPLPEQPKLMKLAMSELSKFPEDAVNRTIKQYEAHKKLANAYQSKAVEVYEGEVADQGAAGTLWGAYNAVTAVCDHMNVGDRKMTTKSRAESTMLGTRFYAKQNAWIACSKILKNEEVPQMEVN